MVMPISKQKEPIDQFLIASDLFLDNFDTDDYLDSFTFENAKRELLRTLNAKEIPMIFILGDPGSGKSFLLNFIDKREKDVKIIKFFSNPNFDTKELLETLLKSSGYEIEHKSMSNDEMMEILKSKYKSLSHAIFIDEAQLMGKKELEFLRVLGDLRLFQIVIAMHKKEGKYILSQPHFASRQNKIITLEKLTKEEVKRYLQKKLLTNNLSDVASSFGDKEIEYLHKLSKANFRTIKKLVRTVSEIVNISRKVALPKYSQINKETLTMAAIDIGLIDVE